MTTPTPSYTPEQLRGWADNEQRASLAAVLRAHAVALEDLAAAQEALKAARPVSVEDEDGIVRELRDWSRIYGHALGPTYTQMNDRAASRILALKADLAQAQRNASNALDDYHTLKAELASVKASAEAMAEVLGWLNRLGGLGLDKHAQIEKVLVAYRTAHSKDAP